MQRSREKGLSVAANAGFHAFMIPEYLQENHQAVGPRIMRGRAPSDFLLARGSSMRFGGARTAFYFLQFPYLLLIPLSCKPPNLDETTPFSLPTASRINHPIRELVADLLYLVERNSPQQHEYIIAFSGT